MPKGELQLVIAVEENFYEQKKVQNIYTSDVGLKSVIFLPVLSLPTCQRTLLNKLPVFLGLTLVGLWLWVCFKNLKTHLDPSVDIGISSLVMFLSSTMLLNYP